MIRSGKSLNKYVFVWLVLITAFILCCCGESGSKAQSSPDTAGQKEKQNPFPNYREAVFDEESAEGNEEILIDVSHANQGYFGVRANSDARLKMQVLKEGETEAYVYDLVNEETDFFPFQDENGAYEIHVLKNAEENKYYELYSTSADITLENEFVPFLIPCQYADYSETSACVEKAAELAAQSGDENDFILKVYEFVCDNVSYDEEKAKTIQSGYIPDPDETLNTKKGICFDYAALTASMLRSQGIPTKIIFGYVAPDQIYHAWNMFYTEETGWTTVKFQANPNQWNRLDVTFLANGADSKFTGDGTNYTDIYQY